MMTVALCAAFFCIEARGQFKEQAFKQQYNNDKTSIKDTSDVLFSFREYFQGLNHKRSLKIGTMFAGSIIVPGGEQIYNRQYWKLPIVYGALAGTIGTGIYLNTQGNKEAAKYCFIGAGVAYWATLMDGVLSYRPSVYPHAGKATLFSILVPGLGQIYNHEWYKLPIYLGGMAFSLHLFIDNRAQYNRFRNMYIEASTMGSEYKGPYSASRAKYYMDVYRRYRDYSMAALVAIYLLQVIDANVFSYMHNFEMDEPLSLKVSPTVFMPDTQLASASSLVPGVGVRMGLTF